jgi:hypothetical protein
MFGRVVTVFEGVYKTMEKWSRLKERSSKSHPKGSIKKRMLESEEIV